MNQTNFVQIQRTRPEPAGARLYASTAPGPGRRPGSKVCTGFEDEHRFRKVRILENPEVFFEGAQAFTRCAQKTSRLRNGVSQRARLWGASISGGPFPDRELPVNLFVG